MWSLSPWLHVVIRERNKHLHQTNKWFIFFCNEQRHCSLRQRVSLNWRSTNRTKCRPYFRHKSLEIISNVSKIRSTPGLCWMDDLLTDSIKWASNNLCRARFHEGNDGNNTYNIKEENCNKKLWSAHSFSFSSLTLSLCLCTISLMSAYV